MNPAKRAKSSHRHRGPQRWLLAFSALLIIAVIVVAAFLWNSTQAPASAVPEEPSGFTTLKNHYVSLMQSLNSTTTKAAMAAQLDPKFNQTDLFTWEHSKLTFDQDSTSYEDPIEILSRGKGICVQWSIVYISASLALNQQSRLVVAVDTSTWTYIHMWAEDYYNDGWVHVDPSDSLWNNPTRYLSWEWGKALGGQVRVYAFTDRGYVDVTQTYMSK